MASSSSLQIPQIKIDLCRTCLSKDNELHSVFDVLLGSITLDNIITEVTGIKIERGDGLPSTICLECKEKAIIAFDFKKRSLEADVSFRELFKDENKYYSKTENALFQLNSTNVKTEQQLLLDDKDDYVDTEFHTSVPNVEYNNLEALKSEEGQNGESCLQCKNCYIIVGSLKKLHEHMKKNCIKVEIEEEPTYCPLCGTCYDSADSLTKHMWAHHADVMGPKKRGRPKKLLTSTILNKLSENGYHMKTYPTKTYICIFCKEQCKTKENLGTHMMEHKDTKLLSCILCKRNYLTKINFEQHTCIENRNHLNKLSNNGIDDVLSNKNMDFLTEVFLHELFDPNSDMENMNILQMCNVCNEVFLSESDLVGHNDVHHPELSQRCNFCLKVFASVKSAARHRNICKQIERKHTCNTCGLKFAYEISLNKHILKYHEGQSVSVKFMDTKSKTDDKQYQCDTCNRCFYRKDLLAKHTKIHMPNEKYFECDVCKKKFHRRDNLRSHKRVHDYQRDKNSSNNCLCLYCGRSFSNSSNLIVHMRRHTGEKPYKCDFCDKGFPRSSDLQCHRRSHTGEKPFECSVCRKGFSRSNKLSRHMRVHTGLKPYKCTYCDKAFSQSNDLTLHIRRHTGDKPYICEICGDRFIQGTALHNHRRSHGHYPTSDQGEVQLTFTVQNISHNIH